MFVKELSLNNCPSKSHSSIGNHNLIMCILADVIKLEILEMPFPYIIGLMILYNLQQILISNTWNKLRVEIVHVSSSDYIDGNFFYRPHIIDSSFFIQSRKLIIDSM